MNTYADVGAVADASHDLVVIDPLHIVEESRLKNSMKDARDIARILANVDPSIFSLLTCRGLSKVYDSSDRITGVEFIFNVPPAFRNPCSLRTYLLASNIPHSLDYRFRIAKLIARSISFLHSAQIVHKNVSPETILLLEHSQPGLESPFLVGFEKFRRAEGQTYLKGDVFWEKNLYRHPK